MMKKATLIPILFVILLMISCASTSWTEQWKDQSFKGMAEKIFVVAVVPNRGARTILENELVSQLKARGIDAIGSTEVLQDEALPTKESVAPKVKEKGSDTVLVIKFIKKETAVSHSPVGDSGVPVTFDANMDTLFQFPETTPRDLPSDFYLATMQLTIYHVATGKPIWSATSETKYQAGGIKQARPYARAVLRKLVEEKLIR